MKTIKFYTVLCVLTLACVAENTRVLAGPIFIRTKRFDEQSGKDQLPIWQPTVKRILVQGV